MAGRASSSSGLPLCCFTVATAAPSSRFAVVIPVLVCGSSVLHLQISAVLANLCVTRSSVPARTSNRRYPSLPAYVVRRSGECDRPLPYAVPCRCRCVLLSRFHRQPPWPWPRAP
ncbi:hypothetical protein BD413DRAFT_293310 [Trametes elegans]|nr:hypothetical protein BD413DRAFT_293310 [Trametes elegans]